MTSNHHVKKPTIQVVSTNRKAYYDYTISKTYEVGLVLQGTEIKSIREGKVNIRDSYAYPEKGELWLINVHISPYSKGGIHNHAPTRRRKLLLHRKELATVIGQVAQRGFTLIPTRLYIKGRVAKIELGLGKGKRQYDKRETTARREAQREIQRALKHLV